MKTLRIWLALLLAGWLLALPIMPTLAQADSAAAPPTVALSDSHSHTSSSPAAPQDTNTAPPEPDRRPGSDDTDHPLRWQVALAVLAGGLAGWLLTWLGRPR